MTPGSRTVSIVIPAYKSAPSLPCLLRELFELEGATGWELQVVVVDDASPDGTWADLKKAQDTYGAKL